MKRQRRLEEVCGNAGGGNDMLEKKYEGKECGETEEERKSVGVRGVMNRICKSRDIIDPYNSKSTRPKIRETVVTHLFIFK